MINIAVDAMGGSNAPKSNIEGAIQVVEKFPDVCIRLYGDEAAIRQVKPDLPDRIEVVHTSEHLLETDQIFDALKEERPVSIILAAQSVASGDNQGLVSAGSTGGVYVSALTLLGVIDGIHRPGGLMHIPSLNPDNPSFVCLDVGLNADVKARNLDEFAVLGSHYAQTVQGKDEPKVALLSNGTEDTKGNKVYKEAFKLLAVNPEINFVGNVEPHGLMDGEIDVLVADGFSGNVYLKQHEEMSEQILNYLKKRLQVLSLPPTTQDTINEEIAVLKRQLATARYGACLVSGLKAPVVITHGRSDALAMARGIQQLRAAILEHYVEKSVAYFEGK